MNIYCVMCRTGSEKKVADEITKEFPSLEVIAPVRLMQEKRNKTWREREKTLLPGYVFIFAENDYFPVELPRRIRHLYRILDYGQGLRLLAHEDLDYAMWIYRHQGQIAASRIMAEGNKVLAIEGPLADVSGVIVRLDQHKRRAWVEFDFDGRKRTVSLSAEWLSPVPQS